MKKILPILFTILFLLGYADSFAQCYYQDTALIHRTRTNKPYAIAISNSGKIAVSSVIRDSVGKMGIVKVWKSVYDFMAGLRQNDSMFLISPQGVAFDTSNNLYVVQTERADSNVMIYDTSLHLVKAINNSPGTAVAWSIPRGIAIDLNQNLYIISGDSVRADSTSVPHTSKLIKITQPLTTATKSLLLSHLDSAKAVTIDSNRLYITEFGANKVSRYNLATMTKVDSVVMTHPMDIAVKKCRTYTTEQATNTVKFMNTLNLNDTSSMAAVAKPLNVKHGKFGTQLNKEYDLFICDNDSNRVIFFSGKVPTIPYIPPVPDTVYGEWPLYTSNYLCVNTIYTPVTWGTWVSDDTNIVKVDTNGNFHIISPGITNVRSFIDTFEIIYVIRAESPIVFTPTSIYANTDAGFVYGGITTCYLNAVLLQNNTLGGEWSSSNNEIAEINGGGVVWPNKSGYVTMHYGLANSCGFSGTSFGVNIIGKPDPGIIIGDSIMCFSSSISLTETVTGTWLVEDNLATIDTNGVVHGITYGNLTVGYRTDNGCDENYAKFNIHIDSTPVAGTIVGADSVCSTQTISLIDTTCTHGGKWSSSDSTVASVDSIGIVTGVDSGLATISYTVMNSCDTLSATKLVRVLRAAEAGTIYGPDSVCVNADITLQDTTASVVGTWSSSNTTIATVNAVGVVHGILAGSATISYIVTGTCGNDTATFTVGVRQLAHSGAITGTNHVCPALSVTLSHGSSVGSGVWRSRNSAIATVNASGVVTGVTAGSTTIYFISTNACNIDTAAYAFTVDAAPHAGTISGPANGCIGNNYPLSLTGASGTSTWISSDPSIAAVDASGMLYTALDGTVTITHISSTVCGSDSSTFTFTVDPNAYSGPIDGIYAPVCMGSGPDFLYAYSAVGTGYWYSDDPTIADVDAGGMVTYYNPGTVNIHYMTTTACTTDDTYMTLTVNPLPVPGGISGADSVCYNASITLSSFGASSAGVWTSSNLSVATVSPAGVVTALSAVPASAVIKYIVTEGCGQDSAIHTVNVKRSPLPGTITGPTIVCNGSTISLSGVNPGGTWSSSNVAIATVSTGGVVGGAGFLGGSATISYTFNTYSCGSAVRTAPVTVLTLPLRGNITGADTVCQNSFDTLRNHSATPGGAWRSRRGYVTFLSAVSGIDTVMFKGIVAGMDTLVYTVSTTCGTDSAIFSVTINSLPLDGNVTGPTNVCVGATISLIEVGGTPLGNWSSSDPLIATVNALTGVVTGNAGGPVVITYSGSTACGSIPDPYTIMVDPLPNAVIAPTPSDVCMGSTVTLVNTGAYGSGTWSSSNTFIATVDAVTGVAGGNNYGTATISYITTTPTCGADTATLLFTVNPLPVPGLIFGDDTVCSGATTALVDVTPSGVWSSQDPSIATVSTTGDVTGVSTTLATTTIFYTVTSATCGTVFTSHDITVKPLPVAGVITGPGSVCRGSTILLASTIPGVWTTTSPYMTVDYVTGEVTGIATGSDIITNTVSDMCGSDFTTFTVTVTDVPVMTPITSLDSLCQGGSFVATAGPASGSWGTHFGYVIPSTASPTTANVYAASGGIDTLSYTAYNTCGSASVSKVIKVRTLPNAGYVTGTDSLCPGNSATMYNLAGDPGGTWNHTGTHVSITGTGGVLALTPGTDTVYYAVTGYCGTSVATHRLTVNPLPVAGAITGPLGVCAGSSITLSDPTGTPGGTWTCGAGGTITSGGVFTGNTPGLVNVTYEASTLCGSLFAYYTVTVNTTPTVAPIGGTTAICAGTSATLTDTTATGFWSCAPASVATIDALTGHYFGVAAGTATVSYAVSNLCGTTTVTQTVTINTIPVVAAILGVATVCPGGTATLHDGTPGGVWSMSNAHATISPSGMITGVTPGTDTVYYTVTNSCGTVSVSRIATIYAVPGADTIAGPSIACTGIPVTLTTVVTGGTWTASNGNATVAGGVVTGVTAGTDTIYYAVTNACGSATTSKIVTVHVSVVPMVTAAVSPDDTLCGAAPATYTATPFNGGTAPFIQWRRGATNIGTGLTLGDSPADGDVISCKMASNATCPTIDTVYSNNITMHVYPHVIPVVTVTVSPGDTISYIGQPVTFTATLTNCGSSPVYQWYENGTAIAGATSATYSTTAVGNDAYYCIADCNIPCAVAVANHSNVVTLYTGHVGVNDVHPSGVSFALYPNPNDGKFTLTGKVEGIAGIVSYEVIDMMGRILQSGNAQPVQGIIREAVSLDTHTVPGQYLLRLITDNGADVIHFTVSK